MKTNNLHNSTDSSIGTTLVIGATGKTGRRIVERLRDRGGSVRSGSRSGTPPFDWEDSSTWAAALADVHAVYVSYYPDLAVPGAPDAIRQFVDLAKANGVSKLVLLSGRGEEEAQRCEKIVRDSGLDWTIVRCAWFNQNFSENFFHDMVMSGVIALPVGGVREPFVDVDDIADVAVAALTETGHTGQLYELTGPELLSFPDVVAEIAKATGREVRYHQISREEFVGGLEALKLPQDLIDLLDYLLSEITDGRNEYITDGVQRALGREPKTFASYARKTAGTGAWNLVPEVAQTV